MTGLKGSTALVLEDEPIIAFTLEDILLEMGCATVHVASHLSEAERLLLSEATDFAVLDVNIHGQRSYPVADILSQSGVRFIFATGYGELEHPPRYSATTTVTKPYSLNDLENAIQAIVSSNNQPGL